MNNKYIKNLLGRLVLLILVFLSACTVKATCPPGYKMSGILCVLDEEMRSEQNENNRLSEAFSRPKLDHNLSLISHSLDLRTGFPELKGKYLLCPNGRVISKDFWRNIHVERNKQNSLWDFNPRRLIIANSVWDANTLNDSGKVSLITGVYSEIIIGKNLDEYLVEEVNGFKAKFFNGDLNIPTSYKSSSINSDGIDRALGRIRSWTYNFSNSEGKNLSVIRDFGAGSVVVDNAGKRFNTKFETNPIGMMYCTNESVVLRIVSEIRMSNVTNVYGESVRLPIMFWLVETTVRTDLPQVESKPEF